MGEEITIKATPANDALCALTCAKLTGTNHAIACPYTQERWKQSSIYKLTAFIMPPVARASASSSVLGTGKQGLS